MYKGQYILPDAKLQGDYESELSVRRKRNDERSEELSENRQLGCWGTNDHLSFALYSSSGLFISKAKSTPPTPSRPAEKVDGGRIQKTVDRQKTQVDTKEAVDATGRNDTQQETGGQKRQRQWRIRKTRWK